MAFKKLLVKRKPTLIVLPHHVLLHLYGNEAMRYVIMLVLLVAPLPFGSARPVFLWGWTFVITSSFAVLLPIQFRKNNINCCGFRPSNQYLLIILSCTLILTLWVILQTLPINFFHAPILPLDQNTSALTQSLLPRTISIVPNKSAGSLLIVISHILLFVGTYYCIQSRKNAQQLITFMSVVAGLYGAYALINFFVSPDKVLWFDKLHDPKVLSGTFFNRNNYATYAGLGILATVSWGSISLTGEKNHAPFHKWTLVKFCFTKRCIVSLIGITLTSTLLLTGSKAGVLAVFLGLITYALILLKSIKTMALKTIVTFISIAIALFAISGDLLLERIEDTNWIGQRATLYQIMLEALKERPIHGYGLGTFEDILRVFRPPSVADYFVRGHSEFLESFLTLGVPATILVLSPFLLLLFHFFRNRKKINNEEDLFVAATLPAAIVLVGSHALVDFPMQIPAISYFFVALLGVGFANLEASINNTKS